MDSGPIHPVRGFDSPRDSSSLGGQGRVTAALDAQDHGMVTRAFPKSISSPGMIPSPLSPISHFTAPGCNNPPARGTAGHPCRRVRIQRGGGARAWAVGELL